MPYRMVASVGMVLVLVIASPAESQQTLQFGCPGGAHRQFDFWVGKWNVTSQGKPAGVNDVTLDEEGCLIHEHWKGAGGGTGQSFNFFDRADGQWHQVWIDNQGNVLRLAGGYGDEKMRFTGLAPGPDGKAQQQRLTFFNNQDGSVRQLWETSSNDGKTWQVAFDGLYRKGE